MPDQPTEVVYLIHTNSGRGETARVCWASQEQAIQYAQRQGLRGWRLEQCTHLPAPKAES